MMRTTGHGVSLDSLLGGPVVVLDFETTGLHPRQARVIEVAAIRIEGGVRDEFVSLAHPETGASLPQAINDITGITPRMLAKAPSSQSVFKQLSKLIFDRPIMIGHNIGFDLGFLRAELSRHQLPHWNGQDLCTLHLARKLARRRSGTQTYPWRSFSLEAVCETLGIRMVSPHRAYGDALATEAVALRLVPQAHAAGLCLLSGRRLRTLGINPLPK